MLSFLATNSMRRRPSISWVLLAVTYGKSSSISACSSFGRAHWSCMNGSNGWNTSELSRRSSPSPPAVPISSPCWWFPEDDLEAESGFQPRKDEGPSRPLFPLMSSRRDLKSGRPSSREEADGWRRCSTMQACSGARTRSRNGITFGGGRWSMSLRWYCSRDIALRDKDFSTELRPCTHKHTHIHSVKKKQLN